MEVVFIRTENLLTLVFIVLICIYTNVPSVRGEITAKVTRQLVKYGFHRDLLTEVMVEFSSELEKDCRLMLAESLPAGSYIDIYQIRQLAEYGGPGVLTGEAIDLEKPEYLSKSQLVYVYQDVTCVPECAANITLPVHLRYHRPVLDEVHFVKVEFASPQPYYTCDTQSDTGLHWLEAPCNGSTSKQCSWTRLPYTMDDKALVAMVPVGDSSHLQMVTVVTLGVTGGGCAWLLVTIWRKSHMNRRKQS